MSTPARLAAEQPKAFYDARYETGAYMTGFADLFEACRYRTICEELNQLPIQPRTILDYGCGEGRYYPALRETFPRADILGSDVSDAAVMRATERHPGGTFMSTHNEDVPLDDATVDLVLSVEVLEHVGDVGRAIREIGRVLAPGGRAVLTTPCANRWSLEWVINRLRGGLQPSSDGYGRFATDEPGHLRRLTSCDLAILLGQAALAVDHFSFRAHLFTTLMATGPTTKVLSSGLRTQIAMLDWELWRHRPNAATMIAVAVKPGRH
jgi:SAM-dependent methyltransferase